MKTSVPDRPASSIRTSTVGVGFFHGPPLICPPRMRSRIEARVDRSRSLVGSEHVLLPARELLLQLLCVRCAVQDVLALLGILDQIVEFPAPVANPVEHVVRAVGRYHRAALVVP